MNRPSLPSIDGLRRLLLTLGVLFAALFAPPAAFAQTAAPANDFDHLRTGFALSGAHVTARCEACHLGGRFRGTARDCESCHTSGARLARGNVVKTAAHIATTQTCDTCHNTRSFAGARMSHVGVAKGSCTSCHNGQQAAGKPPTHMRTTESCDSCHGSSAWRPATGFDHTGVAPGTCATCHDGVRATGRGSSHVPYQLVGSAASAACDTCHRSGFRAWTPAKVHTSVTIAAQCATCHASVKPATQVHVGQTVCETCHRSTTTWTGAKVDHGTFTAATNCSSCHNGSGATGKNTTHIPDGGTNCVSCHSTTAWKPTKFNHTQLPVTAQCATCHSGAYPPADGKTASHVPYQLVATTAAANCDACHKSGYASWTPARVHANVTIGAQCATCHASIKPATQVHVGQTVCETCHRSTTTWTGAKVDHGTFTAATNCTSCHNGSGATGKNTTHIPDGGTNCYACHTTTTWKPSKFNHTQVPVTAQCATCHSGAYPPADGKTATHVPYQLVSTLAAANCDTCHRSGYTSWAGAKVHVGTTIAAQCKTCHNGSYTGQGAVTKPANHIPEAQLLNGAAMDCSACHTTPTSWSARMNHNNSLGGGAGWCKSCHMSGTNYAGSMERKSLTHKTKTPPAIDCSESGCHRPLGSKGTPYTKWN